MYNTGPSTWFILAGAKAWLSLERAVRACQQLWAWMQTALPLAPLSWQGLSRSQTWASLRTWT